MIIAAEKFAYVTESYLYTEMCNSMQYTMQYVMNQKQSSAGKWRKPPTLTMCACIEREHERVVSACSF